VKLLSLSRAARLVGQSRGALQKQIQDGGLTSFEGKIDLDELSRLYPKIELEDNSMLEKVEEIIERARFKARNRPSATPDRETLAARVSLLSDELAQARLEISNHNILMEKLRSKLNGMAQENGANALPLVEQLQTWLKQQLVQPHSVTEEQRRLLARDMVLRVMAAQVHLNPSGHEFLVEGNNTLLESGLSAGFALNYGCSNGNCGKCKARLLSGEVKKVRQHDYVLTEAEKAQQTILMCSHTALTDLVLETSEAGDSTDIPQQSIPGWVKKQQPVSETITVLNVRTPRTQRLRFLAGQRVNLTNEYGHRMELPVASCPCDELNLQFHINLNEQNDFIDDLVRGLKTGSGIMIDGPGGEFILQEEPPHPLLFLAMDTGFAPVKSLIEHALTLDVAEAVHLYRFYSEEGIPYLDNLCRSWQDAFDHFTYHAFPCAPPQQNKLISMFFTKLAADHPDLSQYQAYIAGPASFVEAAATFCRAQSLSDELIHTECV